MLTRLAIDNYRSLLNLRLEPGRLTLVTGPNGSGKSNLYRGLRLLAESAQGGVVNALAREGGLHSTFWAGPEFLSRGMRQGETPIQGTSRRGVKRMRLGFGNDDFGYAIALGLPSPSRSFFALDPHIKHEAIWAGPLFRPASLLVERQGPMVKIRTGRDWDVITQHLSPFDSMFTQVGDAATSPEILSLREIIRGWRFYDHFRTDREAPARQPQLGTRTPVLHHDGRDLAAALQTIREIGDKESLDAAIADAYPGAELGIVCQADSRFGIELRQHGLLRPLSGMELSDGTLRYLLWVAALLTPRPPPLMVLNEPETSLHPDLLPALARLIQAAARHTQVWVVSHANRLLQELREYPACQEVVLQKELGQTLISGQGRLDGPAWRWPDSL
jgi:predicted ATPase